MQAYRYHAAVLMEGFSGSGLVKVFLEDGVS